MKKYIILLSILFVPNFSFAQKPFREMNDTDKAYVEKNFSIQPLKQEAFLAGQVFSCGIRSEKWVNYVLNYLIKNSENKVSSCLLFLIRNGYEPPFFEKNNQSILNNAAKNEIYKGFNLGKISIFSKNDCNDAPLIANILDMKSGYIP